jgi:hypothetical protein
MTTPDVLPQLQAWTEGRLSARQTQRFLEVFLAQPVWFPGTRQTLPGHPGKSLHRLHLSPGPRGGLPTLPVWLADPAALDPPETGAMLQYNAAALLVFALTQRFHLRIDGGGAGGGDAPPCVLLYEDLLNLRTLLLLRRLASGEAVDPGPVPDASKLAPPLLGYCQTRPGVSRAWLAVVSSAAGHQIVAMVEAQLSAEPHIEALERLLDPLMPPGVPLSVIDAAGNFNPGIRRAVGRFRPLHAAGPLHRQWLARLRRMVSPPVVPVVRLEIDPDGAG